MPSPRLPVQFSEWRPDIALLDVEFCLEAENVFPGVNSYKPFLGLDPLTTFPLLPPLPGVPCGLVSACTSGGVWKIYGGTTTGLFSWDVSGWTDVSRTTGGAYNVAPGDLWQFEQSGTHLVAVQQNDVPQWIDIDVGTHFAALPGSPPRARNIRQIGDFLFLSGLAGTGLNDRCIQWSAINDITGWSVGTNLSDMQQFPDGGSVQGVAGSEIGYVVQNRAVRTMQFLPGDTTFIFNFSRVLNERGCISRYGFGTVGNVLYFVAEDGFYAVAGQQVTAIGSDKVNDWWVANSEVGTRDRIQIIKFPNKPRLAWAFHSTPLDPAPYDHLIIFDWSISRWSHAREQAWVWSATGIASRDLDLDTTGSEPGDVDLDSTARSLDSFAYVGGRPMMAAIDENGILASLTGLPLAATLETSEVHLVPGRRAFVSDAYPLMDGAAETVAVATRERLQDTPVWQTPMPIEITGSAAVYSSARLHRFRVRTAPGELWTHGQGVMAEVQQDGSVA